MRLLKAVGRDEFHFVQVPTHNNIPYAILSHTWVHGQEVTYQDLINGEGKYKSGYEKIKFCGEQANKDGFLYFWVDTCCIDKSDPTELERLIQCSADVAKPGGDAASQANQSTWEVDFQMSRWFTRGWTLQELIAPAIVEFFSLEGKPLGDKTSLEMLIHEITEIPIKALRGNPFSDFSIAERKEWAAKRQTTEQEDMVYCLIGLCEVSMPLLYGEGKEKAFKRLEVAVNDLSDSSVGKNRADNELHCIIPFDRNPYFTGRGTQLTELEEKLFERGQTTKVAITGLGGVGKTQLVLEFIYRTRDKHSNCSVIWISAANVKSINHGYLNAARQIGLPGWEEDKSDVKKLLQDYLSTDIAGKWLLVFDNADNIDMWIDNVSPNEESGRLIDYLPRSEHGCIVFTTRDSKTAVKLAKNKIVNVPEMDECMAIELLQKCLVNADLVNNRLDTTSLLKELTYLPLAIIQATAYINENSITFSDYLLLLSEQEADVIDLLSEEFTDDSRYQDAKNAVAITWFISFEQIRHRDPLATDYLSFMACVDPKDIPIFLLPPGLSRKKETGAIGTLKAYSFISHRSKSEAFDLHRLVHLATRNWLRTQDRITQWTESAITQLDEVFPNNPSGSRGLWRMCVPHARYVLTSDVIDRDSTERFDLVWKLAMCLDYDGRYNEVQGLFIESLRVASTVFGPGQLETMTYTSDLALTSTPQGSCKEFVDLEVLVKEFEELHLLPKETEELKVLLEKMSVPLNEMRVQLVEAQRKELQRGKHMITTWRFACLASRLLHHGRPEEAEKLQVLVIEASKKVHGHQHPTTLSYIVQLASIISSEGRLKEAEILELQVLEARKSVQSPEDPTKLASIEGLARILSLQGHGKEAEDLQVPVLETRKRALGLEHPATLTSMETLAKIFSSQGRWKEAENLQVPVLETRKRVLGLEHPATLTSMETLAKIFSLQGRWKEAADLQVLVVGVRKRVAGQQHPSTLMSMSILAFTLKDGGKAKEAIALLEKCFESRISSIGEDHSETQATLKALNQWREELGLYQCPIYYS